MKKYLPIIAGISWIIIYSIGVYLSGIEIKRGIELAGVYVIGIIFLFFVVAFGRIVKD